MNEDRDRIGESVALSFVNSDKIVRRDFADVHMQLATLLIILF